MTMCRWAVAAACALAVLAPGTAAAAEPKGEAQIRVEGKTGGTVDFPAAGRAVISDGELSFADAEALRILERPVPLTAHWTHGGALEVPVTGPAGVYCIAVRDGDRTSPRVEKVLLGQRSALGPEADIDCPDSIDSLPSVGQPGQPPHKDHLDEPEEQSSSTSPDDQSQGKNPGDEPPPPQFRATPSWETGTTDEKPTLPEALPAYAMMCDGDARTIRSGIVEAESATAMGIAADAKQQGEWRTGLPGSPQLQFTAGDADKQIELSEVDGPGSVSLLTIDPVGAEELLAHEGESFSVPAQSTMMPTLSFSQPGQYTLGLRIDGKDAKLNVSVGELRSDKGSAVDTALERCEGAYSLVSAAAAPQAVQPQQRQAQRSPLLWLVAGGAFGLGGVLLAVPIGILTRRRR